MAPTAPRKRPSIRTKTSKPTTTTPPSSSSSSTTHPTPSLPTSTKRDKRTIKSTLFKHRIEKSRSTPSAKRRRPSKKLISNLESLADALPELDDVRTVGGGGAGKVKLESLTSGKGLMRRRGRVEKVERERFGRNLGMLMGARTGGDTVVTNGDGSGDLTTGGVEGQAAELSATTKRFQALRAWIGETMERDGAFEGKE